MAAGAFRGVKHEMMLRWRPSDLTSRPGQDVLRLSSVSFPRRRIRTSLLIKLAAAASCSLPDLKAPSAPSADVSPSDARPEKQDEGLRLVPRKRAPAAATPRCPTQTSPQASSLLRRALEVMRGVSGEHLSFYFQTSAQRGRPAPGVTLRLIEQRTLRFNDFCTSRSGTVYLLKCCNKAEC